MEDHRPDTKHPTWAAASWGAMLGVILFGEGLVLGAFEPGLAFPLMVGLGILLGVEWNELHFLERHGVAGFFARWALAGASVGASAFGVARGAEGWPWWGFFGALGIGAVLGSAVGLEWGRLLGDPPWVTDRQIEAKRPPGILQIDRGRMQSHQPAPDSKRLDRPREPDGA